MTELRGPVQASERIQTLDIVRGFALLGILICTTLFYGWGFGLWGSVGPALQLALAFAIFFVIQVPLSAWWLKQFEYGPLEYLWRLGTYGRRPAVVATAPAA